MRSLLSESRPNDLAHQLRADCPPIRILRSAVRHRRAAPYDEERRFDHERLSHWLDLFRLTKVGGLPGAEQGPFHASGHIDGPGMEWVIETINPERILPVHTQKLGWFEARWSEKVVRGAVRKGRTVRLAVLRFPARPKLLASLDPPFS